MKTLLKLFLEICKTFPLYFVLLLGLVIAEALLNTLSVMAIAPVSDFLLQREGASASRITQYFEYVLCYLGFNYGLMEVCIFFCAATAVSGLANVTTLYAVLKIKYKFLLHLLTDTIEKFFNAQFHFFLNSDMGALLNTFQQEMRNVADTFGQIVYFTANLVQAVIFLMVPLALSPKLTIVFLVTAGVISAPLWLLHRQTYDLGQQNTDTANRMAGVLYELFAAAKLIISFGRQKTAVQKYQKVFLEHADVTVKFQTLKRGLKHLFIPIGIMAAMIAVYTAYVEDTPFSEMAMVLFAFLRLMPIIGLLMEGKASVEGFVPAYKQVEKLRLEAMAMQESNGVLEYEELADQILFEDVSFEYSDHRVALKNVNLKIPVGQTVAFVGKSGAGKTTLADLILALYHDYDGRILLDGKPIEEYNLNTFRERIGYVPQEPFLFNASIKENLLWASPGSSESDILNACRLSNADKFIGALPSEWDTVLGDRGIKLSGGQRQRLALARALIRKPDILILDEATSSLDSESEKLIQHAIESLANEMTIIIIAHRLSTIKGANYIYVFQEGSVVEEGTYYELTGKANSKLSEMIRTQSF